ncbi:hypothetical protein ACWEN3_07670 [Streptomyces sp. NPDC004561]
MADHGGDAETAGRSHRSRLSEYADMAVPEHTRTPAPDADDASSSPRHSQPSAQAPRPEAEEIRRRRREFAALLGEFRRTPVLVPTDEDDAPLTADHGGIRWIYAFSNESALARFALARGEGDREWAYQRWLGGRLLDAGVPAVGVPCGVALDVGTEGEGVLFPPVMGIVPDAAAVDRAVEETNGELPR